MVTQTLPPDLQFSQANLQDFVDCRRRFQLRYLLRLAWPALQAEPALETERHMRQGAHFHRLIHQHLLGVPASRLSAMIGGEDLDRWWQNYLAQEPTALLGQRHPEVSLFAPLERDPEQSLVQEGVPQLPTAQPEASLPGQNESWALVAKLDLVVITPAQRAVIFDWKTSRRRPSRAWLTSRLQTRVYPYLLVRAGAHLNEGRPLQPQDIEMVYWFAEFPDQPERFVYSDGQYRADAQYLAGLVRELETLSAAGDKFPLTPHEERCRFCVYRSLCDRGVQAGALEGIVEELEVEESIDFDIDFEQVGEITY